MDKTTETTRVERLCSVLGNSNSNNNNYYYNNKTKPITKDQKKGMNRVGLFFCWLVGKKNDDCFSPKGVFSHSIL